MYVDIRGVESVVCEGEIVCMRERVLCVMCVFEREKVRVREKDCV